MEKTEASELANKLNDHKPGFLPEVLFAAIARLTVLTAIEFLPIRKTTEGKVQVLLFERPADDRFWPNMLHTPGTILRPTDTSFDTAFDRLFKDELFIDHSIDPIFLKTGLLHYKRGLTTTIEYLILYEQEPPEGTFYDVDDLPTTLIPEQLPMIKNAVEKFLTL